MNELISVLKTVLKLVFHGALTVSTLAVNAESSRFGIAESNEVFAICLEMSENLTQDLIDPLFGTTDEEEICIRIGLSRVQNEATDCTSRQNHFASKGVQNPFRKRIALMKSPDDILGV
jgi:hypothetical protein